MNAWFVRPEPHTTYRPVDREVREVLVDREWVGPLPFHQCGHEGVEIAISRDGRIGQLNGDVILVPVRSQWDELLRRLS